MKAFARIPGSAMAVGAFVLTVLLGVGGASASALWQQQATATMTVTANGTWPGPAFTLTCSDPSKKTVSLGVQLNPSLPSNQLPAQLTVGVVNASTVYSEGQITAPARSGTITLATGHPIFLNQLSGPITIQVSVAYADGTSAFIQRQIHKGNGNSEVTCT